MIQKVSKIRNIGSFVLYDWGKINPAFQIDGSGNYVLNQSNRVPIDSEFKKFNILYGENSTGKSTLVRIFKGINSNTDNLLARNWDHLVDTRELEIKCRRGDITFSDPGGWQNNFLKEKIIIFDREFIDSHIHTASIRTVIHDKNTGKLILFLGDFYIYKQHLDNLYKLRDNLTGKNRLLIESYQADLSALIGTQTYAEGELEEEFNLVKTNGFQIEQIKNELNEKLSKTRKEAERLTNILNQAEKIAEIEQLEEVPLITSISEKEIRDALAFTVSVGTIDIIERITGKEDFIHDGLKLIAEKELQICPFCNQSIKSGNEYIHVIKEYQKIFDEEFSVIQEQKVSILRIYREVLLKIMQFKIPATNEQRLQRGIELGIIDLSQRLLIDFIPSEFQKIFEEELSLVDKKINNLLTPIDSKNAILIKEIETELNKNIEKCNLRIKGINSLIIQQKEALKGGEVLKAKDGLIVEIKSLELKFFVVTNDASLNSVFLRKTKSQKNSLVIKKITELLDLYRNKVKDRFEEFVRLYFVDIKDFLSKFCPNLKVEVVASRSQYDLRAGEVLCGIEIRYKGKDRLGELSEGERQSIALAFFFAFLRKAKNPQEKIVFIDDPITSFDAGKRKSAVELIYKETASFLQMFVLTCDPLFRYYCLKGIKNDRKIYSVLKSASSSSLHHIPNDRATIYAAFKADFRNIDSVNGTEDNVIVFGQKLRFCIEEVKDTYLGYSEDNFDQIMNKVKRADFNKLKNNIDEILAIYSYCNTGGLAHYPRDGQTSWEELEFYVKKYLRLNI